jgi:hypothetical protein
VLIFLNGRSMCVALGGGRAYEPAFERNHANHATIASACRMRICLQVAKHSRNEKAHHLLDSGLF